MIRTSLPVKKSLKPKKCRHCGNSFSPISSMSKACSVPCAIALTEKAKAKQAAKVKREERKSLRERKEKLKTRKDLMGEAQDVINLYVRLRDADDPCISCDKPATWRGQWHASHFKSVGSNTYIRFNLLNIHKACSPCNRYLGGNYAGYLPRLTEKIGADRVAFLEGPHEPRKFDIEYLKRLKKIFRKKIRRLRARRGDSVTQYEEAA